MAVKFGLFVPQGWKMDLTKIADPVAQYEAMVAVAKAAEAGPWDSIWVYDHFHTVPEPTLNTTFECWTTCASLARETSRVRIGQMVTCNRYRNPALLAKMASTVDVASHGRLNLGIGAGWHEHEWRAYGFGTPDVPERMRMFREGVKIIHKMLTEDRPTFHGEYYTIDGPINEPKSATGHIPLWIGGGGEKVTLKLVAQYGDACNIGRSPEICRHKLEVLKQHCETLGRDYNSIIKSTEADVVLIEPGEDPEQATAELRGGKSFDQYTANWEHLVGDTASIRQKIQALADAGIEYVIVYMPNIAYDHTPIQRFAEEVIPAFS